MSYRIFSNKSFNVFQLEKDYWDIPPHKHNFYELIFIEAGYGWHLLNGERYFYQTGDVFLLYPDDEHEFEIEEKTLFCYIKFTEQLIVEKIGKDTNSNWSQKTSRILLNTYVPSGSLIHNCNDQKNIFKLMEILKLEYTHSDPYSRQAVLELFGAMMIIIARNLDHEISNSNIPLQKVDRVSAILSYLRVNIGNKEMLNSRTIAEYFHMSPHYVSIFIKKHTGSSIKKLVTDIKLQTADRLLKQSEMTIGEIAIKLGYNDSSHFHKIFKKHRQKTPSQYRKENQNNIHH